jgi:hypothetical protein
MKSLSELSKGEFKAEDINEMESMILKALDWNMTPPTSANFCGHFHALLPPTIRPSVRQTILQRSCFFSELAVIDYSFIAIRQSETAFAAVLNVLEGLNPSLFTAQEKQGFIELMEEQSGMCHNSERINLARDKLWDLYRRSKQFEMHDIETVKTSTDISYESDDHLEYQSKSSAKSSLLHPSDSSTMRDSPTCISSTE